MDVDAEWLYFRCRDAAWEFELYADVEANWLAVCGKFGGDRARFDRAWAKVRPLLVDHPDDGRYLTLPRVERDREEADEQHERKMGLQRSRRGTPEPRESVPDAASKPLEAALKPASSTVEAASKPREARRDLDPDPDRDLGGGGGGCARAREKPGPEPSRPEPEADSSPPPTPPAIEAFLAEARQRKWAEPKLRRTLRAALRRLRIDADADDDRVLRLWMRALLNDAKAVGVRDPTGLLLAALSEDGNGQGEALLEQARADLAEWNATVERIAEVRSRARKGCGGCGGQGHLTAERREELRGKYLGRAWTTTSLEPRHVAACDCTQRAEALTA